MYIYRCIFPETLSITLPQTSLTATFLLFWVFLDFIPSVGSLKGNFEDAFSGFSTENAQSGPLIQSCLLEKLDHRR